MALRGIKVLELAGLAPGPFCGMILSDFGATVIRIDKVGASLDLDCLANGKQSIALNLKHPTGIQIFRTLCKTSDILLDTYRPGVMESLGIGPDIVLKENPRLIYARLTGYGQTGSFAKRAGHDINYVAMSGLLSLFRRDGSKPFPSVNTLADFGGGGLTCAFGIILALFERERSKDGKGQVIDCSMTEGSAYIGSWLFRSQHQPVWISEPGTNLLDGGCHFYDTYETKDHKYMAVGALEPQFYSNLLKGLDLTEEQCPQSVNSISGKELFTKCFQEKTQQEWCDIFDKIDACVTPVLTLDEAKKHAHNVERESFVWFSNQNDLAPGPAPKLSSTPGLSQAAKPQLIKGKDTEKLLKELNYSNEEIMTLETNGIIEMCRNSKL